MEMLTPSRLQSSVVPHSHPALCIHNPVLGGLLAYTAFCTWFQIKPLPLGDAVLSTESSVLPLRLEPLGSLRAWGNWVHLPAKAYQKRSSSCTVKYPKEKLIPEQGSVQRAPTRDSLGHRSAPSVSTTSATQAGSGTAGVKAWLSHFHQWL